MANPPSFGNVPYVYDSAFFQRALETLRKSFLRDVPPTDSPIFTGKTKLEGLVNAADDTAAATAGVEVGQVYRNGSVLMIRVT